METYIMAIVNKLDANSLILLLVLYGFFKIFNRAVDEFKTHGVSVTDSLKSIAEDTGELRKDLAVIASRVDTHESRLDKLESK